jgi:prepilin-type N-terminal cleavage/methylation domain-containing protein
MNRHLKGSVASCELTEETAGGTPAPECARPRARAANLQLSTFNFQLAASRSAFTLVEVILAVGIFAIVLVAINTAFFAAVRLRQKTSDLLEKSRPLDQGLALLRRDLQNAVPPGGTLAGNFRGNAVGSVATSTASSTSATGQGLAGSLADSLGGQNGGLDFFTTTGTLSDDSPWGDIQEVNYQLSAPADPARALGRDLVRSVNRNLLAVAVQPSNIRRIASDVESFDLSYYDGLQWRDSWDTSAGDAGLPLAVRVTIQLAQDPAAGNRKLEPLQMLVVLDTQSRTNQ